MSLGQSRTLLPGSWSPKREREVIIPELLIPADERDLEDFLLDFEEDLKALHSVQCTPSPGEKSIRPASAAVTPLHSKTINDILATLQSKIYAPLQLISISWGLLKIQMFVPWSWPPV